MYRTRFSRTRRRSAISRRVCAEFGYVDALGTAQLAGCLKALRVLEAICFSALALHLRVTSGWKIAVWNTRYLLWIRMKR